MQSVSSSTRSKRVSAGVAVVCATALAGGAVVGPQLSANAAPPQARKVTLHKNGVNYKCKALNPIVNQAMGGPQKFLVNGKARFKGSFKSGTKIHPKGIHLTLVMPKKLVKKVRRKLGVKRVKGSADVKFDLRSNRGTDKLKVKGLKSGYKKLPRNKKLNIPTKGHAAAYKIPKKAKNLKLLAPKKFKIHAFLRPPALGSVKKVALNCKFKGGGRSLGKFPIK